MNRPGWITPREWQRLQAEADRTGQPVRVKRINPSRRPKVGEIWHGMKGDRCRILNVSGTQVTVLQLDTGHRVNSEMNDFLASYKPPRGRVGVANGRNPKGLNFPKVPAESLKVGDVVMPPEREMRLWMIRDAAEKGMSPTDLGIMLTDVHEGEPDKRGRWATSAMIGIRGVASIRSSSRRDPTRPGLWPQSRRDRIPRAQRVRVLPGLSSAAPRDRGGSAAPLRPAGFGVSATCPGNAASGSLGGRLQTQRDVIPTMA